MRASRIGTIASGVVIAIALVVAFAVHPRQSGIDVRVVLAGACPAPGKQCSPARPYSGLVEVRKPGRTEIIAGHRAPARGRFRLRLDPGRYVLFGRRRGGTVADPVVVVVKSDRFARATVRYRRATPKRGATAAQPTAANRR